MATATTDALGSDPIQNWLSNGAGTEKVRITSAGRIGIGTTSPVTIVDIISNGATMGGVADSGLHIGNEGSANDRAQIALGYPGIYVPGVIGFITVVDSGHTYGDMYFGTRSTTDDAAPTERMRIMSSGKVGIGTASPARLLHVAGFARYTVPAVQVGRSNPQSIPSNSETTISWPTHQFDNDNLHSDSTNPSRLTVSEAGIWAIGCNILWGSVGAGTSRQVNIRKNGGSYIAKIIQTATGRTGMSVSTIASLSANDYVEVSVIQDYVSDVDVGDDSNFWMHKISD